MYYIKFPNYILINWVNNCVKKFREGKSDSTVGGRISIVRRNGGGQGSDKRKDVVLRELTSIGSSVSLTGGCSNDSNKGENTGSELVLSLDSENFVLDLYTDGTAGIGGLGLDKILRDGFGSGENKKSNSQSHVTGGRSVFGGEFGFLDELNDKQIGDNGTQMMLWSCLGNEDFMCQGEEESSQIFQMIEKEREKNRSKRSTETVELLELQNKKRIEVVNEAQERETRDTGGRKRVRSLSHIDLELGFRGSGGGCRDYLELLMFDECILESMDERLRGWDSHKWWQEKNERSEKKQFQAKFGALSMMSTRKRVSVSLEEGFGAIEKHRGGDLLEYNQDLGMDAFNFGTHDIGSPRDNPFRKNRDTIESTIQYRDSLNSSEDELRVHSGRDSMLHSNSLRGFREGVRLSAMLETSSVVSFGSSPFQLDKSFFTAQGSGGRSAAISRDEKQHSKFKDIHRTSSIDSGISDIFSMEEVKSSGWSKSGITTSSGTYNLKTYTVQKFLATKIREIKEIRKINRENGYIIDKENKDPQYSALSELEEQESTIFLSELLPTKTTSKGTASVFFYHLLVLATYSEIKLTQKTPGGDIQITKTYSFNEES